MSRTSGVRVKNGLALATARERARQAVVLAERYGLENRPILAPALTGVGCFAAWMGEFDEAERWLRRAWAVAEPHIDPAAAVLLHASTGMLHAARGRHQAAIEEFAAALRAQTLPEVEGSDTVLTGALIDSSALFGVVAQIEALGLELLELRQTDTPR